MTGNVPQRQPASKVNWVVIVSILLSILATLVSISPFLYEKLSPPGVVLHLPDRIRIEQRPQKEPNLVDVYTQPSFTSTGNNQKVEIIGDMTITVQDLQDGPPMEFRAVSYGRFATTEPGEANVTYKYIGETGVLTVPPNGALVPVIRFQQKPKEGVPKFYFEPNKSYKMTFTAEEGCCQEHATSNHRNSTVTRRSHCGYDGVTSAYTGKEAGDSQIGNTINRVT